MPMPSSWSKKKKERMVSLPCRVKPDADNLCKAIMDGLWPDSDSMVHSLNLKKVWTWPGQGRVHVIIKNEPEEKK
jgi:Holliday junction resolvase RusA-like endonuclease